MSFDAEDVMKRAECPECGLCVEDYAPGVSCVTVDGLMYHPACAPPHDEDSEETNPQQGVHDVS